MTSVYEKELEKRIEELESTIKRLESGVAIKNEMLSLSCNGWRVVGLHCKRYMKYNNSDETTTFSFVVEKNVKSFLRNKKLRREYQFDIARDDGVRMDTTDKCTDSETEVLKKLFAQLRNAGFIEQVSHGNSNIDQTFRISNKWKDNF
jgi:hypothetical protein